MDYYEILGVSREATEQEIKKAFRQIARECHPDVTGDDPKAAERFKDARKAYETLIDPVTRSRYDRRGQRRAGGPKGGSFFDAFYRQTGEGERHQAGGRVDTGERYGPGTSGPGPGAGNRSRKGNPKNDLDLEDLFKDFGADFGFGKSGSKDAKPKARTVNLNAEQPGAASESPRPRTGGVAAQGADVEIDIEVNAYIATSGGTVTAVYQRAQRSSSWRHGSPDPGVTRIQDIADVRIIPGTRDGEYVREKGLGDAGEYGGPYGDLIVKVRVVGGKTARGRGGREDTSAYDQQFGQGGRAWQDPPTAEEPHPRRHEPPPPAAPPPEPAKVEDEAMTLDISVVEAILGGRVEFDTPQGRIRVSIPPGTSSGVRMRLKGRGPEGSDLFVVIRIVAPKDLDDESRRLIEEFARLNPNSPRG